MFCVSQRELCWIIKMTQIHLFPEILQQKIKRLANVLILCYFIIIILVLIYIFFTWYMFLNAITAEVLHYVVNENVISC